MKDTVNGIEIIFNADSNQGGLQKVLLYTKIFLLNNSILFKVHVTDILALLDKNNIYFFQGNMILK